jgi:hypothetical protein
MQKKKTRFYNSRKLCKPSWFWRVLNLITKGKQKNQKILAQRDIMCTKGLNSHLHTMTH